MTGTTQVDMKLAKEFELTASGPEKRRLGLLLLNKQLTYLISQTDVEASVIPTQAALAEIREALSSLLNLIGQANS